MNEIIDSVRVGEQETDSRETRIHSQSSERCCEVWQRCKLRIPNEKRAKKILVTEHTHTHTYTQTRIAETAPALASCLCHMPPTDLARSCRTPPPTFVPSLSSPLLPLADFLPPSWCVVATLFYQKCYQNVRCQLRPPRGREEGSKEGSHREWQKNEVDNGGGKLTMAATQEEEEEEAETQAEKVENENNAAAAIEIENLSERGQRERECCVGGKKQTERKRGRDRERARRQAKV